MSDCTILANSEQVNHRPVVTCDVPVYGETITVEREDSGTFNLYFGGKESATDLDAALAELPASARVVDIVTTYHCDYIDCPGVSRDAADAVHYFPSTIMKFRVAA